MRGILMPDLRERPGMATEVLLLTLKRYGLLNNSNEQKVLSRGERPGGS